MAIGQFSELKTAVENWLTRTDQSSRTPEFIALGESRVNLDLKVRAMEASAVLVWRAAITVAAADVAGTANAITLTSGESRSSNVVGQTYIFTIEANNTAAVTLNVDSIGAVAWNKGDGTEALEADDLLNGVEYRAYFDGTRFRQIDSGAVPLPSRHVQTRRFFLDGDEKQIDYVTPQHFWTRSAVNTAGRPKIYTTEGNYLLVAPVSGGSIDGRILYYRKFPAMSADSDTNWALTNVPGLHLYAALLEAAPYLKDDSRALTWATLYEDILDRVHVADRRDRYPSGSLSARSEAFVV